MKRIIIFTAIMCSLAHLSFAQKDHRKAPQLGIKAGANYSNVYDAQGEQFAADPKLGWVFGGFLALPLGKYVGLQPEILLSQKGFKGEGRLLGFPYELTRTTTYIDVPLLLTIKPVKALSIVAGPQYSFLTKQKDDYSNGTTTVDQEQEFDNDNIRKNTLCFIGGLDFNTSDHVVIGAKVGWDFMTNHGDGTSSTPRYKNVWYQLTLGVRIY